MDPGRGATVYRRGWPCSAMDRPEKGLSTQFPSIAWFQRQPTGCKARGSGAWEGSCSLSRNIHRALSENRTEPDSFWWPQTLWVLVSSFSLLLLSLTIASHLLRLPLTNVLSWQISSRGWLMRLGINMWRDRPISIIAEQCQRGWWWVCAGEHQDSRQR